MQSDDAETKAAKEKARKSSHAMNFSQPLAPRSDRYSEDVADWNIMNSDIPTPTHAPAPLNINKNVPESQQQSTVSSSSPMTQEVTPAAISRKPIGSESVESSRELDSREKSLSSVKQNQRLSLDKSLPSPPQQTALSEDPALGKFLPSDHNYLVKDAAQTPSLEGVVNLQNTVDTTVTETWAPGE